MEKILKRVLASHIFRAVCVLFLLCGIICITEYAVKGSSVFFTRDNLLILFKNTSVIAMVSAGLTYVIIAGGIDLSVGSVFALCSAVFGLSMISLSGLGDTLQFSIGILITLLAGCTVGFASSLIIVKGKLNPFIVTLIMLITVRGLTQYVTNSQTISLPGTVPQSFAILGNGSVLGIPIPFLIVLHVVFISQFVLRNMKLGRFIIAMGSNEEAARLSGINIGFYKYIVYILCGLLVGLAGIIQTSHTGVSNPNIGSGYILYAIAAVIIGGTRFSGGKGTFYGTLIGAFIIGVFHNGLSLLYVSFEIEQVLMGIVVFGVIIWDKFRK